MTAAIKSTLLAGLLALGTATFAQENSNAETSQEAPASEESGEEATTGTVLSTGQVLEEVGKTRVESSHGDWELRCIKAPEGQKDPCQLFQALQDQNNNSVAEINIFGIEGGGEIVAGANIVTPLETLLTAQLRMQVDSGQTKVYPYTFCNTIGCVARVGFSAEDIASFKRGNQAIITVVPFRAPTAEVQLTVSLSGFTAGYDAVLAAEAAE